MCDSKALNFKLRHRITSGKDTKIAIIGFKFVLNALVV